MRKILAYGKTSLLAALFAASYSCTDQLDLELETTGTRLVVEGTVTSDSVRHQVRLSVTSDYFSNQPPSGLSEALVEISFGDETVIFQESKQDQGLYEAPYAYRGVPGTTYQLDISQVDIDQDGKYESYKALSTMADADRTV